MDYSTQQVRTGTGFPRGSRFANQNGHVYTLTELRNGTGFSRWDRWTRLPSPAEEARATADASWDAFVRKFTYLRGVYGIPADDPIVADLDRLLSQLRADEFEAGHATGYAQHPVNRKDF